MMWKCIGTSSVGTKHEESKQPCEDALYHEVLESTTYGNVLLSFVSDGAGSASFGGYAAHYVVTKVATMVKELLREVHTIVEADLYSIFESIYDHFYVKSLQEDIDISEFSCTFIGVIVSSKGTICMQIGDGAIIYNNGENVYRTIWWPQTGDYYNATVFLVDDEHISGLKILSIEESISEVALITDGLQMLALNFEDETVFQPFFNNLFFHLRNAPPSVEALGKLNSRLAQYLNSEPINDRTDDDKTIFLGTQLGNQTIEPVLI